MRWSKVIILIFYCLVFSGCTLSTDHSSSGQAVSKDSVTVKRLLGLSDTYISTKPEKAKVYAERAISAAIEAGSKSYEIKSLYQMGSIHIRHGNRAAAILYFENGLEKSKEIDNRFLTAEGYYHLSRFYEDENDYGRAIDYLKQSLAIYEQLGRKKNMADCYNTFGRINTQIGSYDRALQYYFRSLRINEELHSGKGISMVKSDIGLVYLKTSKFDEAHRYFSEALALDRANNDTLGILIDILNIGVAYQKKGLYEKALDNYKKVLPKARRLNYRIEEAILLGNIGSTLMEQGNLKEALPYLFSSLTLRNKIDYNASHTLNDISVTYLRLDNAVKAQNFALQAVESSKKRSDLNQLFYAHLNLANAYKAQGDFESAYSALSRANTLEDSLFGLQSARQMQQLKVIYETEKKERQIEMLTLKTEAAKSRRNTYLVSGLLITLILLSLYMGQRTKSKKNRQLLKKKQEVAEMKSNFFSNISHEFRTPLTLISGPIATLKAGIGDPKMKTQLDIMQKNANRLLTLINQLLDLSKLESGRLEFSPEKTNIVTLVKGVAMTFQSLAEMKKIDLVIETEIEFLEFKIDREKVETILINLIKNAFTYTAEGGQIKVSLGISENDRENDACRIVIQDNGKGIPEQELSHVFNRFYRGSASESGQTGTGIGLALTKELVELHDGSIEVSSTEHEGTEFVVTLPIESGGYSKTDRSEIKIADSSLHDENGTDKQEKSPESWFDKEANPIVLLIEDNEDVRSYLQEILGDSYRIVMAKDGEKGIKSAFEQIPDLIISDVMMPKMDGYGVAETLKQDERTSHIPLILLTAKAGQKDKMQGLKTHADGYLTKPFMPEELRLRIRNLIEAREQLREKYKREFMLKPDKASVYSMDEAFLWRVRKAIDKHINDENFTVEQLVKEVGMSRSQLHRKLVALTDQSATEVIRSYRLHRAKDMIKRNAGSVSEISYAVGFGSPSYFSRCFREEFELSPTQFKKNHS